MHTKGHFVNTPILRFQLPERLSAARRSAAERDMMHFAHLVSVDNWLRIELFSPGLLKGANG